jgi:hypothetical protein
MLTKDRMCQITEAEIVRKATLEALAPASKTFTSLQESTQQHERLRAETGFSIEEKNRFECMKEGKEQLQPQFYGTLYLLVNVALTGRHLSAYRFSSAPEVEGRILRPITLSRDKNDGKSTCEV